MINHCEKPMSLPQMKATIDRARELDFLVFACADTLAEAVTEAYRLSDGVKFENAYRRSDIGKRALAALK